MCDRCFLTFFFSPLSINQRRDVCHERRFGILQVARFTSDPDQLRAALGAECWRKQAFLHHKTVDEEKGAGMEFAR